ncbi:MAG: tetratricopeptide repeat protein [bacterium]
MPPNRAYPAHFDALLERARAQHQEERLDEAIATFQEAERLAEEACDRQRADRAFVNRCTSVLARHRRLKFADVQRLREVLMAGENPVVSRLAAYNVARAFECAKEYRKGLFYARIALDRSRILESRDWLASSHNQIGNFLLAEGRFQEALDEYGRALELLPKEPSRRLALILTNLGYARVVLGRDGGLALLYRSLKMLRALEAQREQIFPHLDLCYALLEAGRPRYALRHGALALALAEQGGEDSAVKYALFLVGEAAQEIGDPLRARALFERLQEEYFPEMSNLADVLLTVDVRKLVNLKA